MGENTKIEWARHTFNPWVGCTKLAHPKGSACDHCYAAAWAKRTGHPELWEGERRRTTESNWKQPIKWNAATASAGERHTVFCASLADVFDNQVDVNWRIDLFALIRATPNLIWLLLTKRPENIFKMANACGGLPANAALGTTVEDQERADHRIPHLLRAKAKLKPLFVFLSCEPLIGPLSLRWAKWDKQWGEWATGFKHLGTGTMVFKEFTSHQQWVDKASGWVNGGICLDRDGVELKRGADFARARDESKFPVTIMHRVGKKSAGRLLDGIEHNAMPKVTA